MRELLTMWQSTKMVVLAALTAALYGGLTVPFKALVILPGFTEIRPTVVIPVLMGIIAGPAGAWGAAIGNLIGDILGGTQGPSSAFGFIGNLGFAYTAYKLYRGPVSRELALAEVPNEMGATGRGPAPTWLGRLILGVLGALVAVAAVVTWSPGEGSQAGWTHYAGRVALLLAGAGLVATATLRRWGESMLPVLPTAVASSMMCGGIIGFGTEVLGSQPFGFLASIIAINNTVAIALLLPLLLPAVLPRAKRWGLLVADVLPPDDISVPRAPRMGRCLMWIGLVGLYAVGLGLYSGEFAALPDRAGLPAAGVWPVQAPFLALALIGLALA
ncbi:MAG TPA: hypothetical protein PLD23_06770 [Armatimonadota bacterium]|nr:hypothetical protein [Armatimonadota bacterium]